MRWLLLGIEGSRERVFKTGQPQELLLLAPLKRDRAVISVAATTATGEDNRQVGQGCHHETLRSTNCTAIGIAAASSEIGSRRRHGNDLIGSWQKEHLLRNGVFLIRVHNGRYKHVIAVAIAVAETLLLRSKGLLLLLLLQRNFEVILGLRGRAAKGRKRIWGSAGGACEGVLLLFVLMLLLLRVLAQERIQRILFQ